MNAIRAVDLNVGSEYFLFLYTYKCTGRNCASLVYVSMPDIFLF